MELTKEIFELIFPKGTFEWFIITKSHFDEDNVSITLEEKDIPPIPLPDHVKVIEKKFRDITITDFPLRGKRTLLTFRRRLWKVEGQGHYLKRDIPITFPGTRLEKEFAAFLKEDVGRGTILARFYRKVSADPSQRI
jgi:hypothetical protein